MKRLILASLILVGISSRLASQTIPLHFQSYSQQLYVMPGEQFAICTKAGEVAMADSLNGLWHFSQIEPTSTFSSTLENAIFFNRDTGFVSGFIANDGKYNIIYHTKNAGKSWSKVDFRTSGWADCAWNLPNGEAWMTIAGKGVAYSKDYGFTWKTLPVYDAQQRYQTIFFNQKHEGIIGSVWNTIAYTDDNCNTWKKIPSPLDQQAYNKTDKASRPEINKVCIYKDLLLVSEEGMIFYTKKDTISWKYLPGYISFSTDETNTALYLINASNQVVKTDERFQPLLTTPFKERASDLFTRNGQLFLLTDGSILKLDTTGELKKYPMQMAVTKDVQPSQIYSTYGDEIYGSKGNMIYKQKKGKWEYAFTLPFPVTGSEDFSINKNTLVYATTDSIYYYDITKQTTTVTTTKNLLNDFIQHQVTSVIFSTGSQGCFHSYADHLVYELADDLFVLSDNDSWGGKHENKLRAEKEELSREKVVQFAKEVCLHYSRQPVITDMGFSRADYLKCKEDIKNYQQEGNKSTSGFYFARNNLDFDKLIATVDSVKNIDSVTLNNGLLHLNHMFSTTSNWISVLLKNENGMILEITCYYYEANAFYIPWIIKINGGQEVSTSPIIAEFFQYGCPSLLQQRDKVPVLHELVKSLYR
ncbi:WD40/YVTN/BNR-like repeat-containing protein [Chitinophaga sancti]|uniref:WD40/YVTN/BNR-like repeat-containing protein n=1 Tax=Chitinophaga sancti TaxID=1004 RepID=UPI003F7A605C